MMVECKLGIPNRTYFEIFSSSHPSDKLYSVQVADWIKETSKNATDQKKANPSDIAAAVADLHPEVVLTSKADHIQVEPTEELIKFLSKRVVILPEEIWVQPAAFKWEDGECDVPDVEVDEEPKQNNIKKWLAIALAALSFLR